MPSKDSRPTQVVPSTTDERLPSTKPQGLGLRIGALAIAAALVLIMALIVANTMADNLFNAATDQAIIGAEAIVHAYVDEFLTGGAIENPTSASSAEINPILEHIVSSDKILRMKVWAPDGTVIYSDLPALRGQRFPIGDELRQALGGEAATEFASGTNPENIFERGLTAEFLSIYLPITIPGTHTTVGVYEIYEDAVPIRTHIATARQQIAMIVGVFGAGFLLLVYAAFAGTSALLSRQNRLLRERAATDEILTDLRINQEKLLESEERYRSLFENMLDGFAHCKMIYDDQGRPVDFVYLNVNRAFEQLTGLKNVIDKLVTEVIPGIKESSPEAFETYGRVALTGQPESFELDFKPLAMWLFISVYSTEPGYFVAVFDNITERKRAEIALRESEERFRRAINATREGVWEWDIQTNQEFHAPRWCEIVGYSFDDPEMLHTFDSWTSRIHLDDYDRVMSALNNHLEKGMTYNINYRHRHKSGEYRWQNSRGQAIFDESGKPRKMVGCISDITERKRTEEALLESEGRYRAVVESAQEAIVTADDAGNIVGWNRGAENIFGYTESEIRGQPLTRLMPSRYHERHLIGMARVQSGGEQHVIGRTSVELEGLRKDQSEFPLELSLAQLEGAAGWLFTGVIRDISERKLAEEALRASEERFRVALNQVAIIVFNQDRELQYTWMHDPTHWFGDVNVLGKTDADIFSAEDAARLTEIKRGVLASGVGAHAEIPLRVGGKVGFFDIEFEPLRNVANEIIGITCAALDVTEHRQERDLLQQARDELEFRVAERTNDLRLANTRLQALTRQVVTAQEEERTRVSRELHDEAGQALTALKMNLEMFRDKMPAELTPYYENIDGAVSLTKQTMEHIRMLAHDLRPPVLDMIGLNAALEEHCSEFARRTGLFIEFVGTPLPDLSGPINISLYRILQEALTNISKYANSSHVNVHLQWSNQTVSLSVEDNGQGFNVEAYLSNRLKPVGIGLIGMRERLQTVGGELVIDSETGRGTRVVASVPWRET